MNYKNYGLKDGFAPNVYVEKIIVDYYESSAANLSKADPFQKIGLSETLGGDKSFEGIDLAPESSEVDDEGNPIGSEVNLPEFIDEQIIETGGSGRGIQLEVKANIVIEANNYEDFESIITTPDFGNETCINTYLFISFDESEVSVSDPLLDSLLSSFNEEPGYQQVLEKIIKRGNKRLDQKYTLASIVNSVVAYSQTETLFDKISLYQKQLPNGNFYYQIPFNLTFRLDDEFSSSSPRDIHLFTFANVENFNIDFNLNFGEFIVDDEFSLVITDIPVGQLNVETVVENGETKNTGIIAKISENQRTYGIQEPIATLTSDVQQQINQNDILRENKFSAMANSIWLGGIHKHPQTDRYMAGSAHSDELHPFVDLVPVLNSKLIDLRPLRDLGKSNLAELQSKLSLLKTTKINYYANTSKTNLLQKLNVISEPLLSMRLDNDIDGIFGIDYISFIRKHSVFSGLIDSLLVVNQNQSTADQLDLRTIVRATLKVEITRIDKEFNESKLIYDSSRADQNGIFSDRPNFKTLGYPNNDKKKLELGYLNVIELEKQNLNINTNFNAVEFYTFTDLDKSKKLNADYHYEIKIQLLDPMFIFLENGLKLIDNAINGLRQPNGKKTIGLKQFLNIVRATRGINKSVFNVSKTNIYSYVSNQINQQTNTYSASSIFDIMEKYDEDNSVESFNEVPDPLGNALQLKVVNQLFNSNFIKVLFPGSKLNLIYDNISRILNINNRSLNTLKTLDVDYVQQLISLLTQIEYNIREAVNAVSNVDITKQTTGIGITTSPINSSQNKKIITEKKMSQTKIAVKEIGFNYLSFDENNAKGTKSIQAQKYLIGLENLYSKYYDLKDTQNNPSIVQFYINNYLTSYMFLQKSGVVLPKAFDSDDNNWNQILKKLLLYKQNNISKLTPTTAFTYTQTDQGKIGVNLGENEFEPDENEFKLLKSIDRGQRQLANKGLTLPERIYEGQKFFLEVDNLGEPNQNNGLSLDKSKINLLNNSTTEYFLSYVNNAVENGNKNKNLALGVDIDNYSLNVSKISLKSGAPGTTLPVLSLVNLGDPNVAFPNNGKKQNGKSFLAYYNGDVWVNPVVAPATLFFNRYGDFFFEFINSVKVEYLSGFDQIDLTSIFGIRLPESTININLSSYNWQQLETQTLNNMNPGKVLLCRLTDFIPSAFSFLNIPLISELKFYDKYYKYFLINQSVKTGNMLPFGSTL